MREDPARLRALRLLHRHLPDLRAARRRARFAARAHLPHQGHAGARPAGDRRGGQAYRPLPVLPRLHDHLPLRGALHAPRRSRPRPYREDLPPAARSTAGCARCSPACCRTRPASAARSRPRGWPRPFAPSSPRSGSSRLAAMLRLAPARLPRAAARRALAGMRRPQERARGRVGAARRLRQSGARSVDQRGGHPRAHPPRHRGGRAGREGCCGALVHHMGREHEALAAARANVDAWMREIEGEGLDAILVTASGCGTTVKDYGFMLRTDPAYADKAARVSRARHGRLRVSGRAQSSLRRASCPSLTVAYHSACSLQHGQKIVARAEGFAFQSRLRGQRCAGGTSVLRLGRHLQHSPAGDREEVARPQGREYREAASPM